MDCICIFETDWVLYCIWRNNTCRSHDQYQQITRFWDKMHQKKKKIWFSASVFHFDKISKHAFIKISGAVNKYENIPYNQVKQCWVGKNGNERGKWKERQTTQREKQKQTGGKHKPQKKLNQFLKQTVIKPFDLNNSSVLLLYCI